MSDIIQIEPRFISCLSSLNHFFTLNKFSYCIVGGLAVSLYGEVRATRDIDICLQSNLEDESRIIEALFKKFLPRYPSSKQDAYELKVVFLEVENIPVDILLGFSELDKLAVSSAQVISLADNLSFPICSPEILILYKCLAGSAKDWADIDGIIIRNRHILNIELIKNILLQTQEVVEDRNLLDEFQERLRSCSV